MFFKKKSKKEKGAPKPHHKRPSWWARMSAVALDLGICFVLMRIFRWNPSTNIIFTAILTAIYYYAAETAWGRTPGKIILRMRMVDTKGQKVKNMRLLLRSTLRLIGVLFMMLSWRRVTLLDLCSGCRMEKIDARETATPQASVEQLPAGWR